MLIMIANNTGRKVFGLAARYGNVGHIVSPLGWKSPRLGELPLGLDNGAFVAWRDGLPFDEGAFLDHMHEAKRRGINPRWVVVPDVVTDAKATIRNWKTWGPQLRRFGWPLAFAAQDGMTPNDVPEDADVVFIGGSTEWKLEAIQPFCAFHRRVHVGRVNTGNRLWKCYHAGVESVDGTGFTRGDKRQWGQLVRFLRCVAGKEEQHPLFPCNVV